MSSCAFGGENLNVLTLIYFQRPVGNARWMPLELSMGIHSKAVWSDVLSATPGHLQSRSKCPLSRFSRSSCVRRKKTLFSSGDHSRYSSGSIRHEYACMSWSYIILVSSIICCYLSSSVFILGDITNLYFWQSPRRILTSVDASNYPIDFIQSIPFLTSYGSHVLCCVRNVLYCNALYCIARYCVWRTMTIVWNFCRVFVDLTGHFIKDDFRRIFNDLFWWGLVKNVMLRNVVMVSVSV